MSDRHRPEPYLWLAHDERIDDTMWFLPLESEVQSSVWSDPDIEIEIVWWDQ